MKNTITIIFLFSASFIFGQFTDTAAMRVIDQNRTASEGDMYLDTNAKVYKIGLSTGKLGWLTDNQSIDSLRVLNDSLFVFISRGNSAGVPLDSLSSSPVADSGLQYYTWDINNTAQPNISNKRNLGVPTTAGRFTGLLDDAGRDAINPDTQGYILCYTGTLKVKNTGTFTFESRSDDGSRIYIDDVLVLESWFDQGSTTRSNSIDLSKGEHKIEFWYYENGGFDFMRFRWLANPDGYTVNSEIDAMQFYVK